MKLTTLICVVILMGTAVSAQNVGIKRSDVVFMGAKSADVYEAYGGTVVSWGGHAWKDTPGAIDHFTERVGTAHDLGMRYCAGMAFRTAFAKMIDFDKNFMDSVCRRLDGEAILVPWLWDHEHKGHPAYWFCTNSPGYRKYLKHQCELAMVTDVEGLHIDDYAGTAGTEWRGGCFCEHCMAAFRDYLRDNVSAERLAEYGVASLDEFDYGEYLRDREVSVDDYRHKVGSSLPLGEEFLTFQYWSAAAWVNEIHKYAESLVGHPLMLSVNSNAMSPKALVIAPHLTYFCGEVPHDAASRQVPKTPIFVFKVGDALDRPIACTASGQDWAYINQHQLPGLVRTWIAQAYAYGHQLMAPHRQWAYTKDKGTHWYQSSTSDYAHLYRFVREHAALFDGYEPISHVGIVYSNAAFRANKKAAQDVCAELARANVPARLLMAGDDWMDERLTGADLEGLRAIVVTEPLKLDEAQSAVLAEAQDRIVTWPDQERLAELAGEGIVIEAAERITVLPRTVPDSDERPFVCHLLNRNYNGETDSVEAQSNFTLKLACSIFDDAAIEQALLHSPEQEPKSVALDRQDGYWVLSVPELRLWGLLEFKRASE